MKETRSLVYKFRLGQPITGRELVIDQMKKGNAYRNELTNIERERRATIRPLYLAYEQIAELEKARIIAIAERDEALEDLLRQRQKTRDRSETPEQKKRLSDARKVLKSIVNLLASERKKLREEQKELRLQEDLAAFKRTKANCYVRGRSQVYSGTYLKIEQAWRQACGTPLYNPPKRDGNPNDPRHVPINRDGSIAVQFTGKKKKKGETSEEPTGVPAEKIFDSSSQLMFIEPVDEQAWWSPYRCERRWFCESVLHFRVMSARGKPVWATFPIYLTRMIPKEARVKWAMVTLKKIGERMRWSLCLTIEVPREWISEPCGKQGVVGVDIGWRQLTVAYPRVGEFSREFQPSEGLKHAYRDTARTLARSRAANRGPLTPEERQEIKRLNKNYMLACKIADESPSTENFSKALDVLEGNKALENRLHERRRQRFATEKIFRVDENDPEIRIAVWHDELGRTGEFRVDEELLSSLSKADSLQSIRDRNLDKIKSELIPWLEEQPPKRWECLRHKPRKTEKTDAPQSSDRAYDIVSPENTLAWMKKWRAARRCKNLLRVWKENRWYGDEAGFNALSLYVKQDDHLWSWEESQRTKSRLRRKQQYRDFAAKLARTYHTLVLEQFDLREFAERRRPEEEAENQAARSNRQLVALYEFRDCLVNAFTNRGGKVAWIRQKRDDEDDEESCPTTMKCNDCGSLEIFDHKKELRHTCTKCGKEWDQDENAAKNLASHYLSLPKGADTKRKVRKLRKEDPNADPNESSHDRSKRMARERIQRLVEAGLLPESELKAG